MLRVFLLMQEGNEYLSAGLSGLKGFDCLVVPRRDPWVYILHGFVWYFVPRWPWVAAKGFQMVFGFPNFESLVTLYEYLSANLIVHIVLKGF